MKLRRAAPPLLVLFASGALMQQQPSLAVWIGTLLLPFLVSPSLFVARWWSATPPQFALIAAAFSTTPAVHHAWVFNVEGEAILAWSVPFALVPCLLAVVIARRAPLVRQIRVRRALFAVIAVVGAFSYGMGAAYFANTFFDRGPVKHYDATVKARMLSSHYGFLFKQYEVNVSPWGDHKSVDSITVTPDVIGTLRVGGNVRIEQSPGLLGIPWVRIVAAR